MSWHWIDLRNYSRNKNKNLVTFFEDIGKHLCYCLYKVNFELFRTFGVTEALVFIFIHQSVEWTTQNLFQSRSEHIFGGEGQIRLNKLSNIFFLMQASLSYWRVVFTWRLFCFFLIMCSIVSIYWSYCKYSLIYQLDCVQVFISVLPIEYPYHLK